MAFFFFSNSSASGSLRSNSSFLIDLPARSLATAITDPEPPERFNTFRSPLRIAGRSDDTFTGNCTSLTPPLVFFTRDRPRWRGLRLRLESEAELEPDDEQLLDLDLDETERRFRCVVDEDRRERLFLAGERE